MLRIGTEPIAVGASLVGAQATRRIQPVGSYEGNHKGPPQGLPLQFPIPNSYSTGSRTVST